MKSVKEEKKKTKVNQHKRLLIKKRLPLQRAAFFCLLCKKMEFDKYFCAVYNFNCIKEVEMKKLFISLVLILSILTIKISSYAGVVKSWKISRHPSNKVLLRNQITINWKLGFMPVGISVYSRSIYVLYAKMPNAGYKNWNLSWYRSVSAIRRGIQSKLSSGWVPMGMSITNKALFVIYIKRSANIKKWRLMRTSATFSGIKRLINTWGKLNYIPTAITASGKYAFVILLKIPNTTARAWRLKRYSTDIKELRESITTDVRSGWIPWGFMLRYGRAFMLYIK
jgi:hypothetical protein